MIIVAAKLAELRLRAQALHRTGRRPLPELLAISHARVVNAELDLATLSRHSHRAIRIAHSPAGRTSAASRWATRPHNLIPTTPPTLALAISLDRTLIRPIMARPTSLLLLALLAGTAALAEQDQVGGGWSLRWLARLTGEAAEVVGRFARLWGR